MTSFLEPEFDPPVEREGFREPARAARPPGRLRAPRAQPVRARAGLGRVPAPLPLRQRGDADRARRRRSALRTADGERPLDEGEVVAFPVGEAGAHQVVNRGEGPARILIVSEMKAPDIVVRLESEKISAGGRSRRARSPRVSTTSTSAATQPRCGTASRRPPPADS